MPYMSDKRSKEGFGSCYANLWCKFVGFDFTQKRRNVVMTGSSKAELWCKGHAVIYTMSHKAYTYAHGHIHIKPFLLQNNGCLFFKPPKNRCLWTFLIDWTSKQHNKGIFLPVCLSINCSGVSGLTHCSRDLLVYMFFFLMNGGWYTHA